MSLIRFSVLKFFGFVVLFSVILLGFLLLASATGKDTPIGPSKTDSSASKSPTGVPEKYVAASVAAMFMAGLLILVFQLKKARRKPQNYDRDVEIGRREMANRLSDLGESERQESSSQWKELYRAAYAERDPERLVQRVSIAQGAIRELMRKLELDRSRQSQEWRELEMSLRDLQVLMQTESTKHHAA